MTHTHPVTISLLTLQITGQQVKPDSIWNRKLAQPNKEKPLTSSAFGWIWLQCLLWNSNPSIELIISIKINRKHKHFVWKLEIKLHKVALDFCLFLSNIFHLYIFLLCFNSSQFQSTLLHFYDSILFYRFWSWLINFSFKFSSLWSLNRNCQFIFFFSMKIFWPLNWFCMDG
jgi:hypothetical protein